MKAKIMRWDDFRDMCREDAVNWHDSGYKASDLTAEDILSEYDSEYFGDDTADEYDELSSAFTPSEFAAKTLEYLAEIEESAE